MANVSANAIDWYIDLLNRLHIIPANAATLIRSISAKQLGGSGFRPRPLTNSHFTDAELDAIYRLASDSHGGFGPITEKSYDSFLNRGNGAGRRQYYGDEDLTAEGYTSPLRVVSTTLGAATSSKEGGRNVVKDVYDFNRGKLNYTNLNSPAADGKGKMVVGYTAKGPVYGSSAKLEEFKQKFRKAVEGDYRTNSIYGRLRNNAVGLAHTSDDPDDQKIKAKIDLDSIKERLGKTLGRHEIMKSMSTADMALRGIAAGGITGAGAGALLGLGTGGISALMSYIKNRREKDPKKRKSTNPLWTMAKHSLIGAGLMGIAGAATGGLASKKVSDAFKGGGKGFKLPAMLKGSILGRALGDIDILREYDLNRV